MNSAAHEQYSSGYFRYPRSEPDCTTWSFPRQINLTFGRRAKRLHQYPACGGGAQEDETILESGFLGHGSRRFVHLDPPGLDQVLEDFRVRSASVTRPLSSRLAR